MHNSSLKLQARGGESREIYATEQRQAMSDGLVNLTTICDVKERGDADVFAFS